LEQGPVEKKILEQCIRERIPFPEKMLNAPNLIFGLELFFFAFMALSASRQMGMGLGPIPWDAIHSYCSAFNIDEEQEEEMHYHLGELDAVYLEYMRKKK